MPDRPPSGFGLSAPADDSTTVEKPDKGGDKPETGQKNANIEVRLTSETPVVRVDGSGFSGDVSPITGFFSFPAGS